MNAKQKIIEETKCFLSRIYFSLIIILFAAELVLAMWGYIFGTVLITVGYFWIGIALIVITTFIWVMVWIDER